MDTLMPIYDDLMEASVVLGQPGLNGTGITAGQLNDILTRLTVVEAVAETTNPTANQPGVFLSTASHGLGISAPVSYILSTDQIVTSPIFIRGGFTANQMAVFVEVPQLGAVLGLAVYDPAWNLVRDFGTVNAETSGWKFTTAVSTAIPAGDNWLAVRINNVAGVKIAGYYPAFPLYQSASSMQTYGAYALGSVTAFPAVFTSGGAVQDVPWLGLGIA